MAYTHANQLQDWNHLYKGDEFQNRVDYAMSILKKALATNVITPEKISTLWDNTKIGVVED